MKNKIISMILILASLFAFCVPASAAREEEFLSEIALVYEDSVEEARKAIEGTGWKLFEYDLNANADYWVDDGVYLIYKTSTNVEDAITDLRIMDMYGGFSVSNYESQLAKSREEYKQSLNEVRVIAAEFKALYEAGDEMAKLAYRQLNYYKDVKTEGGTETNMLMGDFFLNLPADDNRIVQVLFEGNAIVISNIFSLLAIGLSNAEHSLDVRVAELYAARDTLTDEEYYDDAVAIEKYLKEVAAKIKRYDTLKDAYALDIEKLTEEEFQLITDVGAVATLAESIVLGDVTLADLLRSGKWTAKDVYPLVAAFSEGQMALIRMGAFEILLKHASPSTSIEALNELLKAVEEKITNEDGTIRTIDVYIGVDRSIFKGCFAMTDEAQRQQALTGETWDIGDAAWASSDLYIVGGLLAYVDAMLWIGFVIAKSEAGTGMLGTPFYYLGEMIVETWQPGVGFAKVAPFWQWNAPGVFLWSAIAVLLISIGIIGISTWYNYYNPDYTEIPNTMIDVLDTDLGDKYVKYTAAKVFEKGKISEKNADFNAYEGKEWNALYYTKDATAGNCLTPNFAFSETSNAVARRHQGISMFGEANAYNLNTHVYDKDAKGAYVTIRYSTTEKAAADVPSVVGSMFATGALYVLTAVCGAGIGTGAVLFTQKAGKKETDDVKEVELLA